MQSNKPLVSSKVVKVHYEEPYSATSVDGLLERLRILITTKEIAALTITSTKIEYDCFEERELPFNPSSRNGHEQ